MVCKYGGGSDRPARRAPAPEPGHPTFAKTGPPPLVFLNLSLLLVSQFSQPSSGAPERSKKNAKKVNFAAAARPSALQTTK